jgi:hypothetical protein
MEWFRFYDDVLDDPKVQQLSHKMFRYWVKLLCLANKGSTRGRIPNDVEAIAFRLRISAKEARAVLEELENRFLLKREGDDFVPHNWDVRQKKSDSSAERVAAHRARQASEERPSNVTEPLPQQHSNALETDTEKNRYREEQIRVIGADAPEPTARKRKLPKGWTASDDLKTWARGKGFSDQEIADITERFCRHWWGNGETKLDWDMTWQNWMTSPITQRERARASPPLALSGRPKNTVAETLFAQAREEAGR